MRAETNSRTVTPEMAVPSVSAVHHDFNANNSDLIFLEIFAVEESIDVSLNQWLRQSPGGMLKAHMNIDKQQALTIPAEKLSVI